MNAVLHLVNYAVNTGLIADCERIWALNTLLDVLKADALPDLELNENAGLAETLDILCDYAYEKGLIPENTVTYRDLFDTELMGRLTPRPAEVRRKFEALYRESPKAATDWYYKFSGDTNYIRRDRCATSAGQPRQLTGRLTSASISRSPKRIRRTLRQPEICRRQTIRAVCSARKMRDMRVA